MRSTEHQASRREYAGKDVVQQIDHNGDRPGRSQIQLEDLDEDIREQLREKVCFSVTEYMAESHLGRTKMEYEVELLSRKVLVQVTIPEGLDALDWFPVVSKPFQEESRDVPFEATLDPRDLVVRGQGITLVYGITLL